MHYNDRNNVVNLQPAQGEVAGRINQSGVEPQQYQGQQVLHHSNCCLVTKQ
jgi:hypothetical protein